MIRVLHACDPEEAKRRLTFLEVSGSDAARICSELRPFLLCVPDGESAHSLFSFLSSRGVPAAWGARGLHFSISSAEQIDRWIEERPESRHALLPVRDTIGRYVTRGHAVDCKGRELRLGGSPGIMGILNVTPDSFSDGGLYDSVDSAVAHGVSMVEKGADIVDVGGESTRPGSLPVGEEAEILRIVPVLRALSKTGAILSADTTKAAVAREAAAAGASIINDTSALADDPDMAPFIAESGCAVVLMHRRGTPATMQANPSYGSLFDELLEELSDRVAAAEKAGIPRKRILVDPGIGFGKRLEDNLALHRHLADLRNLGLPIVFGSSRKSFIGRITGKDAGERGFGTAASVAVSVMQGADILRVHDVEEMKDVVRVVHAIREGTEC